MRPLGGTCRRDRHGDVLRASQQFRAVPQATVDPQVIRLPVVEGN